MAAFGGANLPVSFGCLLVGGILLQHGLKSTQAAFAGGDTAAASVPAAPRAAPSTQPPTGHPNGTALGTAYGEPWDSMEGGGVTSKGVDLSHGIQKYVVAVNPAIIPYGTKLRIWPNPFGDPNIVFTAADTGGAFHSSNKIDFYIADNHHEHNHRRLFAWGARTVHYWIVGHGSPLDVAHG